MEIRILMPSGGPIILTVNVVVSVASYDLESFSFFEPSGCLSYSSPVLYAIAPDP